MDNKQIQQALEALHVELNKAASVDDETRVLLSALEKDIQRLSDQAEPESNSEVEPIAERVHDLVLKFETDHPQLTNVLNQISAALANLGI